MRSLTLAEARAVPAMRTVALWALSDNVGATGPDGVREMALDLVVEECERLVAALLDAQTSLRAVAAHSVQPGMAADARVQVAVIDALLKAALL